MSDRLAEIMAWKRKEIEPIIRPIPDRELERLANRGGASPFLLSKVLREQKHSMTVIAEIKRRSPSAGSIAEGAVAEEQAIKYINAEADALSILTDTKYFGGEMKDLWDVIDLITTHQRSIPCLRKDFMVHPIQVVEAAEAGASIILIIVRALNDDEIRALQTVATQLKLDCLFEVHEQSELDRVMKFNPEIIGVNNRDLTRFVTDLGTSEDLIPQIPENIYTFSESGIFNAEDALRAFECGADGVLIGQALMEAENPDEIIEVIHTF